MRRLAVLVLLLAPACKGGGGSAPSCRDRVAVMAADMASTRTRAEIRAGASPWLTGAIDDIATQSGPANVAAANAKWMKLALGDCAAAWKVWGDVGAGESDQQADILRTEMPPALEACSCKASPEDVAGLFALTIAQSQERR